MFFTKRCIFFFFFLKFVNCWDFPHYLQCDPCWGNDLMGVDGPGERATICEEGCAMTDVAMALYALNITIPNNDSVITNPGSLNWWLENNDGYECIDGDCNNLVLPIIDKVSNDILIFQNISKLYIFEVCRSLDAQDTILIAHNSSIPHFVLSVNCDWNWNNNNNNNDTIINIIDPFYNATQYLYNKDINYFLVYNIYNKARSYPYYAQCDSKWGSQIMGTDNDTICQVGCLMSSVSMAIAAYNIPINGQISTPETLNIWLQNNNGYVEGTSDLIEESLDNLSPQNRIIWPTDGMHTTNDIPIATIRAYVQDKPRRVVIANVMKGEHFVLVTDVLNDMDTLLVNDPGQFYDHYSYSKDVVGWRLFDLA